MRFQRGFTPIRDLLFGILMIAAIVGAYQVSAYWTLLVLGILAGAFVLLLAAVGVTMSRESTHVEKEFARIANEKGWRLELVT